MLREQLIAGWKTGFNLFCVIGMKHFVMRQIHKMAIVAVLVATIFPSTAGVVSAAEFTSAKLSLSRVQASAVAVTNTWTLVLPTGVDFDGTVDDEILIDYPASSATFAAFGTWVTGDFTLTETTTGTITIGDITAAAGSFTYPTCTAGANDVVVAVDTTALKIGLKRCTGAGVAGATLTLTIANRISNGTAGTYVIPVAHEEDCAGTCSGSANDDTINVAIDIIDSDQVATNGTVDPTLTFEISAVASLCDDTTVLVNGGTLSLGTITSSAITRSGYICTRLSTNATDGASVYVTSTNGGLVSTSQSTDKIPDSQQTSTSEGAISAGTEKYGLCIESGAGGTGIGTQGSGGTTLTANANFDGNGTCTAGAGTTVGVLSTATAQTWSINRPALNAFANLHVFTAVSTVTEAHTDYADTLTFTVASTF